MRSSVLPGYSITGDNQIIQTGVAAGAHGQRLLDAICPQGSYDIIENTATGSKLDFFPISWLGNSVVLEVNLTSDNGHVASENGKFKWELRG